MTVVQILVSKNSCCSSYCIHTMQQTTYIIWTIQLRLTWKSFINCRFVASFLVGTQWWKIDCVFVFQTIFNHFCTAVWCWIKSFRLSHCVLHTVQFEGAEWDRSCSPTERLRCSRPPQTTGSMKLRKPSDPHSMIGERVDPTLPLEKQVYVQHVATNH